MSHRRRSDSSYLAQFHTQYLVLYFGVTLLFARAAIVGVSRGFASESTVGLGRPEGQQAEPCTNAVQHGNKSDFPGDERVGSSTHTDVASTPSPKKAPMRRLSTLVVTLVLTLVLLLPSAALATGVLPGPLSGGGAGMSTSSCGESAPVALPVDDGTGGVPADRELSADLAEAVDAILDSSPAASTLGAYSAYDDCLMRSVEKLRERLEELYDEKKERERGAARAYTFAAIAEQNLEAIECSTGRRNPGSLDDDIFW